MSLVYEQNDIDTDAGDAPLNWPHEERLEKAAQWATAPGEKLPMAHLEDFYGVSAQEIKQRAATITPFKKEVISLPSGPDYADHKPEEKEKEETLGEWDDDGEWKDGEENDAPEGFDEIIE